MGIFNSYYGMFDEAINALNELTIGGEKIEDDDDEFAIEDETTDDEEASEPETPEGEAEPQAAAEDADDIEPAEATAATDSPENANDADDGIDDDFSLPDDTGDDDTGAEDATTDEPAENDEGGTTVDTTTDDISDDFSMSGDADSGDEDETGTGEEEGTANTEETGEDAIGDSGNNQDELKNEEDKLYDTLTDDQKKIRILQLKILFKNVYEQADSTLNAINDIPKSDENIEIIRRLIVVLNNVKMYISDYMNFEFDNHTYLDNNQIYIKYINIFRTIQKTIDELAKTEKR